MQKNRNPRKDIRGQTVKKISFPPGRIVMGRNTLKEVISHSPERILKVYTTAASERDSHVKRDIIDHLRKNKIHIEILEPEELTESLQSDSHQSFVAVLKEKHQQGLKEFIDSVSGKTHSLVVILDSINDPQNLGALLRAAECFAVDAVLFSKNRGSGLTPVVSKASVGASELLNIVSISNLADAVGKLKQAGYWVVAADSNEKAESIADFKFPEKTVIILGSEGQGIQSLLKRETDFTVQIPLFGKINSLNVSQASGIFLHSFRRQFPAL